MAIPLVGGLGDLPKPHLLFFWEWPQKQGYLYDSFWGRPHNLGDILLILGLTPESDHFWKTFWDSPWNLLRFQQSRSEDTSLIFWCSAKGIMIKHDWFWVLVLVNQQYEKRTFGGINERDIGCGTLGNSLISSETTLADTKTFGSGKLMFNFPTKMIWNIV